MGTELPGCSNYDQIGKQTGYFEHASRQYIFCHCRPFRFSLLQIGALVDG
jgi:hypothetical protein